MLKLNIPNLEAIRNWCNEKFQPKGNYITKSEISNEVNETEITLSDLSETVPEAISAMSEEKKLKNLLSHIKAFMTGSKALIDLCVTTGMITQQNINDENKIPSAALLYSLNDALNGQVAQINSNLLKYPVYDNKWKAIMYYSNGTRTYTVPSNGWILVNTSGGWTPSRVYINDSISTISQLTGSQNIGETSNDSCLFPVRMGDVIKAVSNEENATILIQYRADD